MKKALICLLLLGACAAQQNLAYEPALSGSPRASYAKDLAYCQDWARATPEEEKKDSTAMYGGLIGIALASQMDGRPAFYQTRVDQCFKDKGYVLGQ